MNYDHFERQILGYGGHINCRTERIRRSRAPRVTGAHVRPAAGAVRAHLAVALRNLANHLDTRPVGLA
ncbi:MAG: hypothetical protein ABR598_00805 [Candidatus Dormibacteria bacterium]